MTLHHIFANWGVVQHTCILNRQIFDILGVFAQESEIKSLVVDGNQSQDTDVKMKMPDTKDTRSQYPSWLSWGGELASLGGGGGRGFGGRGILEDVVADVAEVAVTRVDAVTEAAVDV